jgi:hypothetical protein
MKAEDISNALERFIANNRDKLSSAKKSQKSTIKPANMKNILIVEGSRSDYGIATVWISDVQAIPDPVMRQAVIDAINEVETPITMDGDIIADKGYYFSNLALNTTLPPFQVNHIVYSQVR